jgi:hypothetical protein
MSTPTTGSISYSQIKNEFGLAPSFGAYQSSNPNFRNKDVGSLTNLPLDDGIPTSGSMKFSDFLDKRLNVVVDFFSTGDVIRENFKTKYDGSSVGNGLFVVGGYTGQPSTPSGRKIIANVNVSIGSTHQKQGWGKSRRRNVAFNTGEWPGGSDTHLKISIGSNGKILGQGGHGGPGGQAGNNNGTGGDPGGTAIGITDPDVTISITNLGLISTGFGGGGGGRGKGKNQSTGKKSSVWATSSGGGGGGGQGFPVGNGGKKGTGASYGTNGSNGAAGKKTFPAGGGGAGGAGGQNAFKGGNGGDNAANGQQGGGNTGGAGGGGLNGYSILNYQSGSLASLFPEGQGTVTGDYENNSPVGSIY